MYTLGMQTSQTDQVRNLVTLTLEKHGIRAPSVAQHQSLKARSEGDAERAEMWEEVAELAAAALRVAEDG
jgi:hypothetical protein